MLGLLNRSRRWLPGVLAGIGLAIHVAPLCYGDWEFIYSFDDGANFVENPMIQALTLPNIVAMATTVKINVYEPLSWLLKAFVHGLVGMQSKYVRMVSVLVHWTACGILGCATRRLLAPSFPDRASVAIAANLSAILFAIHPVHIEVLMYLRKMSVCLVLSMALVATTYVANQRGAGTDVDTISLTIPRK
ncbi:hypothetical protein DYB25_004818 [Aphanomyces astaci]|uniref:Mannosyltransferase n=1 Tax=Aphanomyces astaci TaxID=112090 RepID=A0A397BXR8_APHAT|nr:hypothetical protein DYB25_004818 [Aphanomyces astaci]